MSVALFAGYKVGHWTRPREIILPPHIYQHAFGKTNQSTADGDRAENGSNLGCSVRILLLGLIAVFNYVCRVLFGIMFILSTAELGFSVDTFQYKQKTHTWDSSTERSRFVRSQLFINLPPTIAQDSILDILFCAHDGIILRFVFKTLLHHMNLTGERSVHRVPLCAKSFQIDASHGTSIRISPLYPATDLQTRYS
jgi:hypothetical protein